MKSFIFFFTFLFATQVAFAASTGQVKVKLEATCKSVGGTYQTVSDEAIVELPTTNPKDLLRKSVSNETIFVSLETFELENGKTLLRFTPMRQRSPNVAGGASTVDIEVTDFSSIDPTKVTNFEVLGSNPKEGFCQTNVTVTSVE